MTMWCDSNLYNTHVYIFAVMYLRETPKRDAYQYIVNGGSTQFAGIAIDITIRILKIGVFIVTKIVATKVCAILLVLTTFPYTSIYFPQLSLLMTSSFDTMYRIGCSLNFDTLSMEAT